MKKRIVWVIIVLSLLFCTVALFAACDSLREVVLPPRATAADIADKVVRIHIRANSNSEEDQRVKLAVRDSVTAFLTEELEGCITRENALEVLAEDGEKLREIAQNTLYDNGYDYKVRVELKKENFPEREYDGYVFPEGEYDALMIYLGEGKGDNWWCVAFPPLCFVPADGGEDITYVSWVKEFLEDIFS